MDKGRNQFLLERFNQALFHRCLITMETPHPPLLAQFLQANSHLSHQSLYRCNNVSNSDIQTIEHILEDLNT
ncbi:hypothetical protein DAPPUDRAFT_265343 [Daphnia pulex]|uniref:Uncharacterized protein n=1 Tax=Daphnia pulex TaxID=6669 RepID=E9HTA0_DAPPU|nr:hypothetical protein DAPPUDRAFT_265343 [Daphnia pulex]|eukprot:EFX65019.1 hypothetical protein DAPPUDRAFT_265343 [Daphnia pulex]